MKSLTVAETARCIQGKKKLVFGDPESIELRDKAARHYKRFKRSGLTEEAFYWKNELKYFGVN